MQNIDRVQSSDIWCGWSDGFLTSKPSGYRTGRKPATFITYNEAEELLRVMTPVLRRSREEESAKHQDILAFIILSLNLCAATPRKTNRRESSGVLSLPPGFDVECISSRSLDTETGVRTSLTSETRANASSIGEQEAHSRLTSGY